MIYSIPLDSARQDASPHPTAKHGGGAVAPGGSSGHGGSGGSAGGASAAPPPTPPPAPTPAPAAPAPAPTPPAPFKPASASTRGASGANAAASASARGASGGHASGSDPILVPGGEPGSLIHSANGFGSSSKVPGVNAPLNAGLKAVDGNGGSAPLAAFALAGVVLLVGGFVGFRAWH